MPAEPGQQNKPPVINCHTHIFTGDHVPDYLGRSIFPWPFWKIKFRWIFRLFRWWYGKGGPDARKYSGTANDERVRRYYRIMKIRRTPLVNILYNICGWWLTLQVADFVFHLVIPNPETIKGFIPEIIANLHHFLCTLKIVLAEISNAWLQALIVLLVLLFFRSGRNLFLFIFKSASAIFLKLPGRQTVALLKRYLSIGRYTFHKEQGKTLQQLENQYPEGTGFVILPMDMEYMGAGKVKIPYRTQMNSLAALHAATKEHHLYPFVFADPRRIGAEPDYFDYEIKNGEVVLKDCFIKEYIEEKKFCGFKIYPALGYYPFDPLLLPLWKYAAQKQLPILTHCIRGPIYYRGPKEKVWDTHPVFKEKTATAGIFRPLLLPEIRNDLFTPNFTHPMNFLCLLEKEWLRKVVNQAYKKTGDKRIKELFGLAENDDDDKATITSDLRQLKLCMGHYGGNTEWARYQENDRLGFSNELAQNPMTGIDFVHYKNSTGTAPGKPEQIWKYTDWYSIISSMMIQYENVYADISFILHNDQQVLPLLTQTLRNPLLRKKVLYGTDFYVVRNLKSDKEMLADMLAGLSEEDFDVIARDNPARFLQNNVS